MGPTLDPGRPDVYVLDGENTKPRLSQACPGDELRKELPDGLVLSEPFSSDLSGLGKHY